MVRGGLTAWMWKPCWPGLRPVMTTFTVVGPPCKRQQAGERRVVSDVGLLECAGTGSAQRGGSIFRRAGLRVRAPRTDLGILLEGDGTGDIGSAEDGDGADGGGGRHDGSGRRDRRICSDAREADHAHVRTNTTDTTRTILVTYPSSSPPCRWCPVCVPLPPPPPHRSICVGQMGSSAQLSTADTGQGGRGASEAETTHARTRGARSRKERGRREEEMYMHHRRVYLLLFLCELEVL